jgi:3-dehydroquinate dehydratase/shikimate dehydrogenase
MLLCVPIVVEDVHSALRECVLSAEHGADIVEYRIDGFFDGAAAPMPTQIDALRELVARSTLPCIVTCRHISEGGQYDGPEDARVSMLEALCTSPTPPAYIDVELRAYQRSANIRQKLRLCVRHPSQLRDVTTRLILSVHDFGGLPTDLARCVSAMHDDPACAVVKVAARARNVLDALELLDVAARCAKPAIVLGMGEFGVCTRVLAGKAGALLTFAPLSRERATAPGQLALRELLETFGVRRLRSATRVYGIVGWPVQQSLSPLVQNAAFAASAESRVYVHLPIAAHGDGEAGATTREDALASRAGFVATMQELLHHPTLHFGGCSVTMPHKLTLAELAVASGWAMDEATRATGAANTLVVQRSEAASDGTTRVLAARVLNTDAMALRDMLREALGDARGSLAGRRVGVVGAGGVGAAAAWAAASLGAHVVVYNRTLSKAEELAGRVREACPQAGNVVAMGLDALAKGCCEAWVQCTSVGMGSGASAHASVMPWSAMRACNESGEPREGETESTPLLIETVYTPLETPTLRAAREAGVRCVDGAELFVRQARLQSEAFVGGAVPMQLADMRAMVERTLRAHERAGKLAERLQGGEA